MECINGVTEDNILENGRMENNMEKEHILLEQEIDLDYGQMVKE